MTTPLEDILERLDQDGPTDVFISENDYTLLREEARRLWSQRSRLWGKDPRSARLFLAFLRGYTFYRPLHDNERQFWSHFYDELALPFTGSVGAEQRDALWDVLEGHPITRPHCRYVIGLERERREFVRAIDEIWGVRSLSAGRLIAVFVEYHLHHSGESVNPALLRGLMPDIDDLTLRQARTYDRIFQALSGVVNFILETDPALAGCPPEVLAAELAAAGLNLGQPNVVHFLANKSPLALAEIIGIISRNPRKRFALRPLASSPRERPSGQALQDVRIQLAPGVYEVGTAITLNLIDRGSAMPGVVRVLVAGRALSFRLRQGQIILQGLAEGHYQLELEYDGQSTGVTTFIQIVPRLQWTPHQREGRLFQGHWEVGRVSTEDGRFALFTWRPGWEETFTTSHHTVDLDDNLSVAFSVTGECIGARLIDVRDGRRVTQINEVDLVPHLAVRPLLPPDLSVRPNYRVFLESQSAFPINAGAEGLAQLLALPSMPEERLIVEVAWDGQWRRVLAVPYVLAGQLTAVVPYATYVYIEGYAPAGSTLITEERGAWSGEVRTTQHAVVGHFQLRRALRLRQVTEARQIVVTVSESSVSTIVRTVLFTPEECPLGEWLTTGISTTSHEGRC